MPNSTFPVRARHAFATAVLALLVAASSAVAAPPQDGASTSVGALPPIRIDNFSRVDAHLYRGAQPSGRDIADLKALGIKTIVDLTSNDTDPEEQALAEAAGMTYVSIPMSTRTVPTDAQIAQFLSLVNGRAGQPVYVHCVGGRHRTGVMTAMYRMTHDGWSGDRAFKEMKQFKYGADFLHPEFKEFVYGYQPVLVAEDAAVATNTGVQR
jgi:protein tyrosine/serine phosphatase